MMPIADAKVEKQTSTEAAEPIKQAITIIEHKVRNLEKRKRKIEIYREDQKAGQTLNVDQLLAVSKYGEVTKTLDFAHELCKQFSCLAVETNKQAKKQARKESNERALQETAKIRDILLIQDILQNMGHDSVREDFLAGRKSAVQLSETDLKYLDDLYVEVSPKRVADEEGGPSFMDQLTSASEHLLALVEGKTKEVVGTTHEYLQTLVNKIQESGYFDLNILQPAEELPEEAAVLEVSTNVTELLEEPTPEPEIALCEAHSGIELKESMAQTMIPSPPLATSLPIPSNLVSQQPPPGMLSTIPTPSVNSPYFSTETNNFGGRIPHQTVSELIQQTVGGSFNFLQDSELDTEVTIVPLAVSSVPSIMSQIPSQTYTNQNQSIATSVTQTQVFQVEPDMNQAYPGTTSHPPPPIPMPPSHQGVIPFTAGVQHQPAVSNAYQTPTQQVEYQQELKVQPAAEVIRNKSDSWAMNDPSDPVSDVPGEWNPQGDHTAEWTQDTGPADWVQQMAEENAGTFANQTAARPYSGSSGGSSGNRSNRPNRSAGGGPPSGGNAVRNNATNNYATQRAGPRPGGLYNNQNGNRNTSYNNYPARNTDNAVSNNTGGYYQQNGYQQRDSYQSNGGFAGQGAPQGQFRQRSSRDRGPAGTRVAPTRGGQRASPTSGTDGGVNPRSNPRGVNTYVPPRTQNNRQ